MKRRKILSFILASIFIVTCFAGCSSKQTEQTTAATTQVTVKAETTTQPVTAIEDEIVSFTVTDKDRNILTLVPIFDKDASTIVAGYIMSANDKNGKELIAKLYPLLNSVVSITSTDGKLNLDTDSKGELISVETYSDTDGNLIAIKDVKDVNSNKNTDEFLKLNSVKDSNKITQYVIEYTVVEVTKDENNKDIVVEGNKKTEVKIVDSSNTAAADKVKKDTQSNETTIAKENESSTTNTSNDNSGAANSSGESGTTTSPAAQDDYINIVLKKNRTASCSSSNVSISTGQVNINKGGNYRFTSETDDWHGQIIVELENTESCELRFEDVNISNDTKNIIQIIDSSIESNRTFLEAEADVDNSASNEIKDVSDKDNAPNVDISFPTGTSSTFSTSANSYTGVLYNESKLTFKGNGSATFAATKNANNCICTTKSITIKNVNLTLTTAQNDSTQSLAKTSGSAKGIFSYSKVTIESGKFTVKSNGDCIRCDDFYLNGGTVDLKSSACDGIDADDAIIISGGNITSIATQKYCYKVRRVNNTEEFLRNGRVRSGADDCFRINGGTVIGEGFRISSLLNAFQSDKKDSAQASVTAKIVKKGTTEASKTPAIITIGTLNKSSSNKVTKFIYSSSSVKQGTSYIATANGKSAPVTWNGNFGVAEIETTSNV